MKWVTGIVSMALVSVTAWCPAAAGQAAPAKATFVALAEQCAPSVDPTTLAAVVRHESRFDALAIHVNGDAQLPRQPGDEQEAIATAKYLQAQGYSFDAGIAQINNTNVERLGMSWAQVFTPCTNLQAAAAILRDCYARAGEGPAGKQAALRAALSCYNTGDFTAGTINGYVGKVERAAGIAPDTHVPAIQPMPRGTRQARATKEKPAYQSNGLPGAFAHSREDVFQRAEQARENALRNKQGESDTSAKQPPVVLRPVTAVKPSGNHE